MARPLATRVRENGRTVIYVEATRNQRVEIVRKRVRDNLIVHTVYPTKPVTSETLQRATSTNGTRFRKLRAK